MKIRKLIIFILCLCMLAGCGAGQMPPVETPAVPAETPLPAATPEVPEADPTPAPTETPAPEVTEPALNDALARVEDDDLRIAEGTLFIGDSITHHLYRQELVPTDTVGGASFMACSNAGIPHYFADWARLKEADWNSHGCSYDAEFKNLSYYKAVEQSAGRWNRIFFMMGSNGSGKLTYESYKEVIDHIYANNPEATIYLQTVPDCRTGTVHTDAVNAIVAQTVAAYEEEGISTVKLLDTNSIWTDECIVRDGVHLSMPGLEKWHELVCSLED